MRFLTLVRVEWIKTMRMLSTYIAFGAAGMLVLLIQLGVYFTGDRSDEYEWLNRHGFDTGLLINAYVTTRMVMEIGFVMLLAPMIIQIFARQIAGEDLRGTLRLVLSRPISRMALINAKFLVCTAYCVLLMGFTLALSFGVGLIFYGPREAITIGHFEEMDSHQYQDQAARFVQDGNAKTAIQDEEIRKIIQKAYAEELAKPKEERLHEKDMIRKVRGDILGYTVSKYIISPKQEAFRIAIAWLLSSWALLCIGSIALFFSVINKHPISAMALTIGTYFIVLILQGLASAEAIIALFKKLKPYLFTTAMDYYRECMSFEIDWAQIHRDAALLGCYTAAFYLLAQIIFWRKDITS